MIHTYDRGSNSCNNKCTVASKSFVDLYWSIKTLNATFVRGLFGPASTKKASNKPAEKHDRRLKFNSDMIEHF